MIFRPSRWSLATQLAAVLATAVLVCAGIIVVETWVYDWYELSRVIASMPADARHAGEMFERGEVPPPGEIKAIIDFQRKFAEETATRSYLALLFFTLTAAGGAYVVGYFLLRGVGRGLTDVAVAARAVANGDLSVRAHSIRLSSREETALTESFNAMAAALEAADRALKDSTAAIAHELRTPLTVLAGRLHGIQDGVFDAGPEQIDSLIHQVDSLTRLVEDLRTLSLVDSHQLVLDLAAIDLAGVVRPVVAAMAPDLEAAGLTPDCHLRPAPMIGDGQRLRQALSAVLTNAQRYARDSGTLRIETGFDPAGVYLRVLDRGPGLSDGDAARAFESFWRGDASRARSGGGTGLGLAVVRAIAEAHAGTVSLTRRAGGGAAFELRLPPVPPATRAGVDTISTKR
jgi:two-component system sensor histidine kinase AdeS